MIDDAVCGTTILAPTQGGQATEAAGIAWGKTEPLAAFRMAQGGIGALEFFFALLLNWPRSSHFPLISRPSTWILRRWTREHEQQKYTAPCRGHP